MLCVYGSNHAYSRAKGEPIGGVECLVHVCAFQHDIITIIKSIPSGPYRLAKAILMMHQKSNVKLK